MDLDAFHFWFLSQSPRLTVRFCPLAWSSCWQAVDVELLAEYAEIF